MKCTSRSIMLMICTASAIQCMFVTVSLPLFTCFNIIYNANVRFCCRLDEITDFSLETVPPMAEKVVNLEPQDNEGAMGIVSDNALLK